MSELLNLNSVFIATAIFSTVLYVLKLVIYMFTGGDSEVSADFDSATETEVSFNFLSIQSVLSFFMGFGWSGSACYVQFSLSGRISLVIALIVGFIFMYLSAYLMYSVRKLNKTVKPDINELKDKIGKAYRSFESKASGQIEIEYNGKLSILDAINDSDEKIESFSQIKVIKIENNQIYIVKA